MRQARRDRKWWLLFPCFSVMSGEQELGQIEANDRLGFRHFCVWGESLTFLWFALPFVERGRWDMSSKSIESFPRRAVVVSSVDNQDLPSSASKTSRRIRAS